MPQLLAPSFLFRFAAPCRYAGTLWSARGANLADEHRLPDFSSLDDNPARVEVRAAWNEQGLVFVVMVTGKKQPPWCRENRLEDSDGLYLWLDTRDTHNIHRASRFCHQFVLLPAGGGLKQEDPVAELLPINRARELPRPVKPGTVQVQSKKMKEGYQLECHIPAAALTGFEPAEHPRLGFMWAVVDREIGEYTFCCPPSMPYKEDPSLWGTLELIRGER